MGLAAGLLVVSAEGLKPVLSSFQLAEVCDGDDWDVLTLRSSL